MASGATRIAVLINEHSGLNPRPDAGEKIQSLFAAAGAAVRLERVRHGGNLAARARQAAGRSDVLVAAGGDGTVGTVAAAAVEANVTFGVLPLGTLNHFARDAGIPLELPEAVGTIVQGHTRDVDVGDLNGRIFVNNSSLGIYPRMIWERNAEQRQGRGKWVAFVIAMARTWQQLPHARRPHVHRRAGPRRPHTVHLHRQQRIPGRGVRAWRAASARQRPSVDLRRTRVRPLRDPDASAAGQGQPPHRGCQLPALSAPTEATIELSRRHVSAAFDGEVAIVRTPLHFRVRRAALHVLVPGQSAS